MENILPFKDIICQETLTRLGNYLTDNNIKNHNFTRRLYCGDCGRVFKLLKKNNLLCEKAVNRWIHQDDKILIYTKGDYVFIFNFHPEKSFEGYFVPTGQKGTYKTVLSSDDGMFGGHSRVDSSVRYKSVFHPDGRVGFNCYLPNRTAIVLKKS